MRVSVIIPTYNRAATLVGTVDSFLDQAFDPGSYEIIIADNNSTDGTPDVGKRYESQHPGRVRYLREVRQGVHYARNAAAKIATGQILYYTDDDMVADKRLLAEIVRVFALDGRVASVTGRILPDWDVPPPGWVLKLMNNSWLSLRDPPEELIISKQDCGVYSCHQAVLREVFFQSGGFNPENTAGTWIGDGETGLNIKIRQLGYKFGYTGASVIYHKIPAQRMTQRYFNRRLANQGSSDSYTDYARHKFSNWQLLGRLGGHGLRLGVRIAKCIANLGLGRVVWRVNLAYVFYHWSRIRYDIRLMSSESWRALVLKTDWIAE